MWVTYDPDYQGTDTLKIMSFILCLAPPCTFWLLAGHRWRSIPCDQELGAVLSETGVFFHTLSLKRMQYFGVNRLQSLSSMHYLVCGKARVPVREMISQEVRSLRAWNTLRSPLHQGLPTSLPARQDFCLPFPKPSPSILCVLLSYCHYLMFINICA